VQQVNSFTAHKFKALDDKCWASLESSEFYFSRPDKLNDPADCQIDLAKVFRLARGDKHARREREEWFLGYAREVEASALTCGVFSLCSGEIDGDGERLLWAHYAMNHAGICMTFTIPYTFVMEHLVGCAPVQYSHEPLYRAVNELDLSHKPDFESEIKPIITVLLTTKSPEWAYEKESRLISFSPGLLAFDRSWLKQICFGLRTSDADRRRVRELAAAYSDCGLVEAVRSESDLFGLTLRELDK